MRLPSINPDANLDSIVIPEAVLRTSTRRFAYARRKRRNDVLHIPEALSVTRWVHDNIEFKGSISNKKGKLKYLSYQRTLADWFMDENVKEVTVLKGTRVGWSIFLASFAMYVAGYLGSSITIAQPTDKDAEAFAKEVIDAMIKCCPAVEAMRIPGSMDIIQLTNGGIIRIIGGTSADNFRRYDSRFNVIDEYSAGGYDNRKGEQGDKLTLFKDRGGAHRHTVTGAGSSPLSKDSCRTYARFLVSDQHYPYIVCPHCSLSQIMEWGDKDANFGFKWECDEVTGYVTDAWYQCRGEECISQKRKITEAHKLMLDETTEYIPTTVAEAPGHRGIHVPQWVSSAGQASFKEISQRFLNSQGKPELLKTFTNNVRAWVWDEYTTSDMDAKEISTLLVPFEAEVPDDVVVLTAGIDNQDNKEGSVLERLHSREIQVVGWNALGQFRIIDHRVVLGEPGDPSADRELKGILDRAYLKRDGSKFYIQAAAHDFGGQSHADEIRLFCNRFGPTRNIWAIKGNAHWHDFIWPKKRSTSNKGATYYTINSHKARSEIFKLMQLAVDKRPMVPAAMGTSFLDKLMCQERFRKESNWYWRDKKGHRPEEEWMCLAYAYAALVGLKTSYKRRWADLNLAADNARIPSIQVDPTSGDFAYIGLDNSIRAVEARNAVETDQTFKPTPKSRPALEQKVNNAPVQPVAATQTGGEQQVRKRRTGGIIH